MDTAINGGSLSDNLETALLNSSVNAAHGFAASGIKDFENQYILHKILHAAAGCAATAAKQAECEAGAIGAGVGEVVAELLPDPESSSSYEEYRKARERQQLLAQFIAGTIAAYSGYDAQTAIDIANTAVTNNRQLNTREIERIKELAAKNPKASEAEYIIASCAVIKCSADLPEDSIEYQIAKKIELEGSKAKYSGLRAELSKQVYTKTRKVMSSIRDEGNYNQTIEEKLFQATPKTDAINRFDAKYQVGTRAEGVFITAAGGTTAGISALGFPTCATGVGCALAVAGTAYGSDVMTQGLLQTYTGKSQNSLGALALHEVFGIPKDTAEAVYSLAGIAGEVNAIRTGLKNAASTGKVTLPQTPTTCTSCLSPDRIAAKQYNIKNTVPLQNKPTQPRGKPEPITGSADKQRNLRAQNEAAITLANQRYDVEQLPLIETGNGYGLTPKSNPDYLINGRVFDAYNPNTSNIKNVQNEINRKSRTQADRVVVTMDDTSITPIQLQQYMTNNPSYVSGALKEVIAIKDGQIINIYVKSYSYP